MKQKSRIAIILTLGLLSAIGPFSIDLYLPGFPEIARDFDTSTGRVALSLSSYFIGVSIGQMIYGPLLDRFGRKIPLLTGLFIYVFSSLFIVYVTSVDGLIVARFVQALGGCAGMVASRALVRDIFPVSENAKIFSLLMLVIAVSPIVAPTIGGMATSWWGWQSIFFMLTLLGVINIFLVLLWLPAGAAPDTELSLKPKPILKNTLLLRTFTSEKIVKTTLICQVIIGTFLFGGALLDMLNLYSLIVIVFLFLSTQGFAFPNTSALALAPFGRSAGSASALMGALQLGIGALMTGLVSLLSDQTPVPMTGLMFLCSLISLMILFAGSRKIK